MFKKSALAMVTVIAAMTLSVPVMAQTDTTANAPARPILYSEAVTNNEISVTAMDKTMFVTADMLYVRAIPSTDGEVIGAFYYGESVKVTGQTGNTSDDAGWFRVVFNNKEGFVTAEYLTDGTAASAAGFTGSVEQINGGQAIATSSNTAVNSGAVNNAAATNTAASGDGQSIIKQSYVYAQDGSLVSIYKTADGKWHDTYTGTSVTWVTDNQATTAGGQALTSFNPTTGPTAGSYPLTDGFCVDDAAGNCQGTMTPYSDGNYYSNDMIRYEDNGDGTFYGAGETLYSNPYESDVYGYIG